MDSAANPLYIVAVFILGACLGSFATALIHRLPSRKGWFLNADKGASRSSCPACGHKLSVTDLIPLFSWIWLRGKCRYCKARISSSYVVTEFFVAIAGVVLFLVMGAEWTFVPAFLALPFLAILIVTNIRSGENFWTPSIAILLLGVASCLIDFKGLNDFVAAVTLTLVLGVAALVTLGRDAVRQNFVKEGVFLAGAGFFTGLSGVPLFLLLTAPLIGFGVIYCVVSGRKSMDFFPSIYAIALIFHLFLTGIGFDGRAAPWLSAG